MFEWDENKRSANLAKHGLDFVAARQLFDGRPTVTIPSVNTSELRYLTIGRVDEKYCAAIWTWRGAGSFRSGERVVSKKERIVRRTDDELRAMQAQGEDKSDWKRVAALSEAEIETAISTDADEAETIFDWSKASIDLPQPKAVLNMRIDRDVLDFFRRQGKGYQTKINAVLRSYVEQARQNTSSGDHR